MDALQKEMVASVTACFTANGNPLCTDFKNEMVKPSKVLKLMVLFLTWKTPWYAEWQFIRIFWDFDSICRSLCPAVRLKWCESEMAFVGKYTISATSKIPIEKW